MGTVLYSEVKSLFYGFVEKVIINVRAAGIPYKVVLYVIDYKVIIYENGGRNKFIINSVNILSIDAYV